MSDQSEEDFTDQEQLPRIRLGYESAREFINAAGDQTNAVPEGSVVIAEPYVVQPEDTEAVVGSLFAVVEEGAPVASDIATAGNARMVNIIEALSTPEVSDLLVSQGIPSAVSLSKLFYNDAVIEKRDGYPYDMIGTRLEQTLPTDEYTRQQNDLVTKLFVETLASLGTDFVKIQPIMQKAETASQASRRSREDVELLTEEILLTAADQLRKDATLSPTELTTSVHVLINASMQGGVAGSCRDKILSTVFGIPEEQAKLFLDTSLSINPNASILFDERAVSVSETGSKLEIDSLLKSLYTQAFRQSWTFLSDQRYSLDKITDTTRSQLWEFITSTSELVQAVETDNRTTQLQQNLMEMAGRFFADDSDVYSSEELGSVEFQDDHRASTIELHEKQPKKVEVDTNLPSERLLGILSRVTSRDRRFLVGSDPAMVQSDIEQIELIRETLVEREPELEQTILVRLSQHFMALGGDYLALGEDAIEGITDQNAREALIESMGYARAMESVSSQDEAKLQAQKICTDSEPTAREMTEAQQARADQLAEKIRQDDSSLVLRVGDPEVLIDILFGAKRVKSMWETAMTNGTSTYSIVLGSSEGPSYLQSRVTAERAMGIADHMDHPTLIEPAISTYIRPGDEPPVSTDGYGFIEISLRKDAVRDRSVYVDGDSANQANNGEHKFMRLDDAITSAAEKKILVEDEVIERPGGPKEPKGWDYVEGLILGGVSRDDIGPEIRIYTGRGEISKPEAEKLAKIITDRDPSIKVTII